MTTFNIKLAETVIEVHSLFLSTKDFCKDYLVDEAASFTVTMSEDDIVNERLRNDEQIKREGHTQQDFTDSYIETLALYRKITKELLGRNVVLFHSCVIGYNEKAYLFTAKSGTGKTTHANLWLENIPGSYILNGDKPLLLFKEDKVYACGTPWMGKENLGINKILPLAGICFVERDQTNHIEEAAFGNIFIKVLEQIHIPEGNTIANVMHLVKRLEHTPIYILGCNMDKEAAIVSSTKMTNRNV